MIYQSGILFFFTAYSLRFSRAILLAALLISIFSLEITAQSQNPQRQTAVNTAWRDGALDTNFGAVLSLPVSSFGVFDAHTLPDGKLLVVGGFKVAGGVIKPNLARLNADGTLDNSIGISIATTNFSNPTASISEVIILPDGKMLICGYFQLVNGVTANNIARLNADGSLDTTFNTGSGFNNSVATIALQPDGKILAAGDFSSFNGAGRTYLARLNADGSLDTTLNATIASFWSGTMKSVVPLSDGKILIQGRFHSVNSVQRSGLARLNSNGSTDTSFVPPATYSLFNGMYASALRPDGKIYIGGFFEIRVSNQLVCQNLCRLNADGTLDTTYFVSFGTNNAVYTLYLQPDGRLLVHGSYTTINGISRNGTTRLNDDGSIDASFNPGFDIGATRIYDFIPHPAGGYLITGDFTQINGTAVEYLAKIDTGGNADASFAPQFAGLGNAKTSTIQPDGKILVSGNFNRANGITRGKVARFSADGTLDVSFNPSISGPTPDTSGSAEMNEMVVQPDGKILLGGSFAKVNGVTHLFLARINSDGSLDPGFNPILTYSGSGPGGVRSIAVQADGKIIIGGDFSTINGVAQRGLARLNADGTFDASFVPPVDSAYAPSLDDILIQPDGKILIGGDFKFDGYATVYTVARFNADGGLDASFALPASAAYTPYLVWSLARQANGKILVGGSWNFENRPLLARLNSDGTADSGFTPPIIGVGISSERVYSVIPQPNGKIVFAGYFSNVNNNPRLYIARLIENGALDFSYQTPQLRIEITGNAAPIYSMNQAADGNLLIGGNFDRVGTTYVSGFARLQNRNITRLPLFDFDADGKTDIGIFRPSVGEWWVSRSSDNQVFATQFGNSADKIVPADFTGDGKTDVAFWRPSTGFWYVLRSENFSFYSFPFGTNGDIPTVGDFDSDGRADVAIFRPSNSTWYISHSGGGTLIQQFGQAGDVPVPADYDDDGKTDIAIFRPSLGEWWIDRSTAGLIAFQFGAGSDKPVPADYTGDGKADVAFWRPSTGQWFVLRSEDFSYFAAPFGTNGDIPAPGDYDGDGFADFAVFRPSTATWYAQRATAGTLIQTFGLSSDIPVPSAFIP